MLDDIIWNAVTTILLHFIWIALESVLRKKKNTAIMRNDIVKVITITIPFTNFYTPRKRGN